MDFSFIEDKAVRAKVEETFSNQLTSEVDSKIEAALTEQTLGLKNKNEELKREKLELAEVLKDIKDPEAAKAALKFLEENEDAKLIKDGKIEELLEKKTSKLRSDHESKILELQQQLEEASHVGTSFKSMFETKMVEDEIRAAALKADVRPEALFDIMTRANSIFSFGEDGSVEARDKDGGLKKVKDDIVMTPDNWIESLKDTAPHYWPASVGAGATGVGGSAGDVMKKLESLASAGKMEDYRKLRDKMLSKK